jgi:hypothetical protein
MATQSFLFFQILKYEFKVVKACYQIHIWAKFYFHKKLQPVILVSSRKAKFQVKFPILTTYKIRGFYEFFHLVSQIIYKWLLK